LSFRSATYSGVFTLLPMLTGKGRENHGRILRDAATMIEAGQLKPVMDSRRFNLGSALQAHQIVEAREAKGRIVVDVCLD
jgi:NADPH:quinone reductase